MKIKSLSIDRMPGLEKDGLELADLGPGLNVIVGPNGSGKTSLCRAVRGLLWSETLPRDYFFEIRSIWSDDEGNSFDLSRRGETIGGSGKHFGAPPLQLAQCYTVTLDQMLGNEHDTEENLAAEIHRQMAGGFSLRELKQSLTSFTSPASLTRALRALHDKKHELANLQAQRRKLKEEELSLPELEKALKECESAENERNEIEFALEFLGLQRQLSDAESALALFPTLLHNVRGNEVELWEDLKGKLKRSREDEKQAEDALGRIRSKLSSFGDHDHKSVQLQLEQLTDWESELQTLHSELTQLYLDLNAGDSKRNELENFLRSFTDGGVEPDAALFLPEFFERTENLLSKFSELTAKKSLLSAQSKHLAQRSQTVPPSEQVILLANLVRRLLQNENSGKRRSARDFVDLLLVLLSSACIFLMAQLISSQWYYVLCVPWLLWVAALLFDRKSSLSSDWNEILAHLQNAGVEYDAPFEPTLEDLEALLSELDRLVPLSKEEELRKTDLTRLNVETKEVDQALSDLHSEFQAVSTQLGLQEGLSSLALYHCANRFREYHQLKLELVAKHSSKEHLESRLFQIAEKINQILSINDTDTPQIDELISQVKLRRKQLFGLRELKSEESELLHELRSARTSVASLEADQKKILEALGLSENDERGLYSLLDLYPDYIRQRKTRDSLALQVEQFQCRFEPGKLLTQMSDLESLEKRAQDLRLVISQKEELHSKIGGIRRAVQDARRSHSVEDALSECNDAESKIRDLGERAFSDVCTGYLLRVTQTENEKANRPAVAAEADRLFRLFTNGSFELHTSSSIDHPKFLAKDVQKNELRELHELSLGTRTQLLLAARLAFVLRSETGQSLPIFLDEVLSSSDPERFEAVAAALLALVKEGRQIFYLSCQPEDAAQLKRIASQNSVDEVKIIHLTKTISEPPRPELLDQISRLDTHHYPLPGEDSLTEYLGKLSLPKLAPEFGSASTHLAYLSESAEQLHRILSLGITTFGELRTLMEIDPSYRYLPRNEWVRLEAKAKALDAFASAWRKGRGKPLSPEVIQSAISSKYTEEIISCAKELKWDGRKLMKRIDPDIGKGIKGLRKTKYQEFVDALTESGHYSEMEPFTEAQARSFVLARLHDEIEKNSISGSECASLFDVLWKSATEGEKLNDSQ